MAHTMAAALRSNFLGNSPDWYKLTIVGFLIINPVLVLIDVADGKPKITVARAGAFSRLVETDSCTLAVTTLAQIDLYTQARDDAFH